MYLLYSKKIHQSLRHRFLLKEWFDNQIYTLVFILSFSGFLYLLNPHCLHKDDTDFWIMSYKKWTKQHHHQAFYVTRPSQTWRNLIQDFQGLLYLPELRIEPWAELCVWPVSRDTTHFVYAVVQCYKTTSNIQNIFRTVCCEFIIIKAMPSDCPPLYPFKWKISLKKQNEKGNNGVVLALLLYCHSWKF